MRYRQSVEKHSRKLIGSTDFMWVVGLLVLTGACSAQYEPWAMASSWSMWSAWSFCSNNVMVRVRACSTFKGFKCIGHNKEFQSCDSDPPKPKINDYDTMDSERKNQMNQMYEDYDMMSMQQQTRPNPNFHTYQTRPARPLPTRTPIQASATSPTPLPTVSQRTRIESEENESEESPPASKSPSLYSATNIPNDFVPHERTPEAALMPSISSMEETESTVPPENLIPQTVLPTLVVQQHEKNLIEESTEPSIPKTSTKSADIISDELSGFNNQEFLGDFGSSIPSTVSPHLIQDLERFNEQEFTQEVTTTTSAPETVSSFPIEPEAEFSEWNDRSAELRSKSEKIETSETTTAETTTATTTIDTEAPTTEEFTRMSVPFITISTPSAPALFSSVASKHHKAGKSRKLQKIYGMTSGNFRSPIHLSNSQSSELHTRQRTSSFASLQYHTGERMEMEPVKRKLFSHNTITEDDVLTGDTARALSWLLANMTASVQDGNPPVVDRIQLERIHSGENGAPERKASGSPHVSSKKLKRRIKLRWSEWSLWSDCNCNIQRRKRICLPSKRKTKTTCPPPQYEVKSCISSDCN